MKKVILALVIFLLSEAVQAQSSFSLPGNSNWYKVADIGGQHGYLEYIYWHSTGNNPSIAKGEIQFINSQNIAIQHHQAMGYGASNQPQFALLNFNTYSEIWIKATDGVATGTFKVQNYINANISNGTVNDPDLSNNGGTLTIYDKLADHTHTFIGNLDVKSGQLNIGGSGTIDASLHIKTSSNNSFDRLTQMSPSVAGKSALNLMGSKAAGGQDQWWAWGVTSDNKWRINSGTNLNSGGLTIDQAGKSFFRGYPMGVGDVNSYSSELGGPNPTTNSGQATLFLHHHGVIAHQLRYGNGSLFLEGAGNGYGTNATPNFFVGGSVGIGATSTGSFKLAVNGKIWGAEVQVAVTNPGPDYVFEKDYALPSLESVKTYIVENKHLPEVPSAKEMEANGINVSEMNMLLLKKVEELTLYVIEQQKELNEQKDQNKEQMKRIIQLEKSKNR